MYRLMSVVSHTGGTSSGHYISDVYSLKENAWQSCNDSSITKVSVVYGQSFPIQSNMLVGMVMCASQIIVGLRA